MFSDHVRVLLLADSHLGFDMPARPRVQRRRRGDDFFANYCRALEPALSREVDLVVHGGDLFHRSSVPVGIADRAFEPLRAIAGAGLPVVVVAGNHERAAIPYPLLATHPNIHLIDRPRMLRLEVAGASVAIAGFPYRRRAGARFDELIKRTGLRRAGADIRLLCVHQCVEGAVVGPSDFTFRGGADVIAGRSLPHGLTAVLAGHIHRHQVLTEDLRGVQLAAPVLYPGSVERTAFAERGETKGYIVARLAGPGALSWRFYPLPARPMVVAALRSHTRK